MTKTRCREWDDRELDILEAFKGMSFVMLQIMATAFFLISSSTINTWKILDFFQQIPFTVVVSCNVAMETFFCISGFLAGYKCLQIYEANGNHLGVIDILKMYARKILRVLPLSYLVFFFGWTVVPYLRDGALGY